MKAMLNFRVSSLATGFAALLLAACASTSIREDIQRVRELARTEELAPVADMEADPLSASATHTLLEKPLDADAAVRIALLNNRDLRASLREIGVARGQILQAGLPPNPEVEVEFLPERDTTMELRLEFDLTHAILAPRRSGALEPDLEAARARAAAAAVDLAYRTRVAFHNVQAAAQRLAVAQQMLDALAAVRDAARALARAGNIPELELAHAEAGYEKARIAVARLELEMFTGREKLNRLLNLHGRETAWKLAGDLAAAPDKLSFPDELEKKAITSNLDLLESRHRLEGLAKRAGFERASGWIPDVSVDVHSLAGTPDESHLTPNAPNWRFGFGVTMGLPVFDRNQGTAAALEAEFDARMERYHGKAVEIRSAARDARNRLISAHARALQYQKVIAPAQDRVTRETLLQYNAMQVSVFQLLQARRDQLDVRLSLVDTLREYWIAEAAMNALLAGRATAPAGDSPDVRVGPPTDSVGGH
ncbi:MAG: Cobalt-zinc-cadmium resistance protein CzcC [Myxococcota bacterium]|nr:Cobalt-zinc-cadmium resistance protein CzcC [Myxococcota bacterium]